MRIEALDPADDNLMARRFEVQVVVQSLARAHYQPPTFEDHLAELRTTHDGWEQVLWSIVERGEMAGLVTLTLRQDTPDTLMAQVEVLPRFRRRGYGARALIAAMEYAASRGRRRVVGEAHYPPSEAADHEYRVFLEHNGFRLASTSFVRALAVPVPRVLLEGIAAQTMSSYFDGYRVLSYEEIPDPLVPSLVALMNRFSVETPSREMDWVPETLDPRRYVQVRTADAAVGRDRLTTIAVDRATEQVVACTELLLRPGLTRAAQLATYVHPAHRGHQLGLAICAANLRVLQEQHPSRRDVHTEVNVETPWMVALLEAFGYRPIEMVGFYHRDLV